MAEPLSQEARERRLKAINDGIAAGKTLTEVAEEMGMPRRTLASWCRYAGIDIKAFAKPKRQRKKTGWQKAARKRPDDLSDLAETPRLSREDAAWGDGDDPIEHKTKVRTVTKWLAAGKGLDAIAQTCFQVDAAVLENWCAKHGVPTRKGLWLDEFRTQMECNEANAAMAGKVTLPALLGRRMMPHASKRGVSPEELARRILVAALDDDKIDELVGAG